MFDEYKVTIKNGEAQEVEKENCGITPKCIRATELHTEICNNACASIIPNGSVIEYGNLGKKGEQPVSGDAFNCDVNNDGKYNENTERFYYVSDLYDYDIEGTDKFNHNVAVLIYYSNTLEDEYGNIRNDNTLLSVTAYDSNNENWNGPITAINNLPSISQWTGISLTNINRKILNEKHGNTTNNAPESLPTSFSYKKNNEQLAARLLTTQEIEESCKTTVDSIFTTGKLDNCMYLLENTQYANTHISSPHGFWLENPFSSHNNGAWVIYSTGRLVWHNNGSSSGGDNAVRPAIEVLKTDIDY